MHPEDALEGRSVDRTEVRRVDLVAVRGAWTSRGVPEKPPRTDWPAAKATLAQPWSVPAPALDDTRRPNSVYVSSPRSPCPRVGADGVEKAGTPVPS